jgi:kynurenine formamidase
MKRWVFRSFLLLLLSTRVSVSQAQPQFLYEKMVDLTHAMEKGMPQFSDAVPFTLHKMTDYGDGYLSYSFSIPEHLGTHVDAPLHFYMERRSVDEIELRSLVGRAVVVNVVEEARRNPDYELTLADLRQWEIEHGPIGKNSIVILRTGWESKWFRPGEYLNRDKNGVLHFPGFSCEVVDYLARNRAVLALGTDTLSIDAGRSNSFCAHKTLHHTNKYAIEGLTNLEKLPPRGATIVVMPLKIKGGSGAPARVIAWVP